MLRVAKAVVAGEAAGRNRREPQPEAKIGVAVVARQFWPRSSQEARPTEPGRGAEMTDEALLELAAGLALQAAEVILAIRARGFAVSRKADRSVVTEADQAAEALIVAGLLAAAPEIPVVAEEAVGGRRRRSPPRRRSGWWIRWTARANSPTAATISR